MISPIFMLISPVLIFHGLFLPKKPSGEMVNNFEGSVRE